MINNLKILQAIKGKSLFKAISGIENSNVHSVLQLAQAAQITDSTYIDICADPKIIQSVKESCDNIVCVSITNIDKLDEIILSGIELIELGNFDHLYKEGFYITDQEILDITKKIRSSYPDIALCVTIPHTLTVEEQIRLAVKLERLNIDLIQTEGRIVPQYSKKLLFNVSRAFASLTSTYVLSQVVSVPIITASNLSELTSSMAIHYGASGIGVSKAIMQYSQLNEMVEKINSFKEGLSSNCYAINNISHSPIVNILTKAEDKVFYSI
uniref:Uncharacterized protein ycf23 n=1 Tax=Porphyridium sordidum TaxID=28024 RepID=A0A1C9CDV4_PORSO|nr:hypothetical protein Psor_106 [Porphyridium sordidum]AOM66581.1 hypothetical protein Psor_106 [Porphyridium sordidum]